MVSDLFIVEKLQPIFFLVAFEQSIPVGGSAGMLAVAGHELTMAPVGGIGHEPDFVHDYATLPKKIGSARTFGFQLDKTHLVYEGARVVYSRKLGSQVDRGGYDEKVRGEDPSRVNRAPKCDGAS